MKALFKILASCMLVAMAVTGCDQPQHNQTANKTTLKDNTNAFPVAPQASTARDVPGSTDASSISGRTLLDNIAANKELSTFASLIRAAELTQNLSGTGPYTVFAPTEEAFKALPDSLRTNLTAVEHQEQLRELLNNHIIAGKLTTNDLQDGALLKTVAGQQLRVSKRNDAVRINGALLEDSDVMSSNGVLHVTNKVLLPAEEAL